MLKIECSYRLGLLNLLLLLQVCHSKAWDSKIVTSAWWVYPYQVSKTAPTGEYLTVGSFMIRGKKNFLPPHPLVMGFGILFRLDESSLASHLNERRVRGEDEEALPDVESQKLESNAELDGELDSDSETGKEKHDDESSLDNINVKKIDNPIPSNAPYVKDNADSSEQLSEIRTVVNSTTSTSKGQTSNRTVSSQLEDLLDKNLGLGPTKVLGRSSLLSSNSASVADDIDDLDTKKTSVRDKPYISKADRRKLKKGQNVGDSTSDSPNGEAAKKPVNSQQEKGKTIEKPANPKVSRGQKGKLKKIKEKYGEQDEEEREIRMALLAVIASLVFFPIVLLLHLLHCLILFFYSPLEGPHKRINLQKM